MYSWNVRTYRIVSQCVYSAMINRHDTTNATALNWWYSVYMSVYSITLPTMKQCTANILSNFYD